MLSVEASTQELREATRALGPLVRQYGPQAEQGRGPAVKGSRGISESLGRKEDLSLRD